MVEVRLIRYDLTEHYRCPMPFRDGQGFKVGQVVSVRFDGMYTLGQIELDQEAIRRIWAGKFPGWSAKVSDGWGGVPPSKGMASHQDWPVGLVADEPIEVPAR